MSQLLKIAWPSMLEQEVVRTASIIQTFRIELAKHALASMSDNKTLVDRSELYQQHTRTRFHAGWLRVAFPLRIPSASIKYQKCCFTPLFEAIVAWHCNIILVI